jgi:hypothetical protein
VDIRIPSLGHEPLAVSIENRDGQLAAVLDQPPWFEKLTDPQRGLLMAGIRGLIDMSAVEILDGKPRLPFEEASGTSDDPRFTFTWQEWVDRWVIPGTKGDER